MTVATPPSTRRPWQRSEARELRPFASYPTYLEDAALQLYPDAPFVVDPRLPVETIDRGRLRPTLRVNRPPDDFAATAGYPLDELQLVVVVRDHALRRSSVVVRSGLPTRDEQTVSLARSLQSASWAGDTSIVVAVALPGEGRDEPGVARLPGSWIAKKTFRTVRERAAAAFDIVPVDRAFFASRNLPADTCYYIDANGVDLLMPADDGVRQVRIYMAKDAYDALSRPQPTAGSDALERSIYVDVATELTMSGFADGAEPDEESLVRRIADRISRGSGVPIDTLRTWAQAGKWANVRAAAQAEAKLVRSWTAASGGR